MFRIKPRLLLFLGSFLIVIYGVSAAFYAGDDAYKELSVFINVIKRIRDDYVEAPDMNKVQEGAMRGLLNALDPYCSFFTKEQYSEIQKRKENGRADIGVVLSKRSDMIYIVSCDRNGPAETAGIRSGDYLIAIDGQGVEDKSIVEVDGLLRGVAGSGVRITIFRSLRAKSIEYDITRSLQPVAPVHSRMLDGQVGLLEVSSLAESDIEQIKIKLKTLISAGAEKLILDLRDCAEGSPSAAAELANYFMRKGIIYYSQNREGERIQTVEAEPDKFITDLPLAILINGSTAAAPEITAGALKDQKRATIVGEKSFGLGSSQKTIQLKSGAVLIISTAKYYTPGGSVIQNETVRNAGIAPDIEVPDNDLRQDLAVESYYDEQEDTAKYRILREKINKIQIDKALEILLKESAPVKKAA
ncbi:MAG: PDZ domain-containing protein [Acidobacteria bacterium]|nr:PDZ domain-containing protein [Acidobacteriota bacterium]